MCLPFSGWVISVSLEVSVLLKFPQMSNCPHNCFLGVTVLLKFPENVEFNIFFHNDNDLVMWKIGYKI